MSVTIGSLFGDHQRLLEDLGLLPGSSDEETPENEDDQVEEVSRLSPAISSVPEPGLSRQYRQGTAGGIPWFEEMVEGSRLGRLLKARRGMGVSDDQSTAVQWEVSEMRHGSDQGSYSVSSSSSHVSGKRKDGPHAERETRSSRRRESPG